MPKWVKWTLLAILVYLVLTDPQMIANLVNNIVHSLGVLGNSLKQNAGG